MKQVKKSVFFQRVCAFMLCLSFVLAFIVTSPLTVRAVSAETVAYINKCYNSTKTQCPVGRIGYAYLVGTDGIAAAAWTTNRKDHEIYAVEPGTKIQGKTFDAKYYPQDNLEYLKDISGHYGSFRSSGKINRMSNGAQYVELEGASLSVVACDKEWVTIWDRGYQSWDPAYAKQGIATGGGCEQTSDIFLQTHPAGFYKIERSMVWLDLNVNNAPTHPYKSKEEIPDMGTGVVTHLAKVRPYPNEDEKTDWKSTPVYALSKNKAVTVVSTELVPSKTPGSTDTYYKVSFNGNTGTLYLKYKVPGVYYINSKCLNFTEKGKALPEGNVPGVITNVVSGKYICAYESKDTNSTPLAYLDNGAELEMYPSESDAAWTTVYFSGKKCYVQTKNIKKGKYKVTDIGKPYLYDIVNNEPVIKWNKGKNNEDFTCTIECPTGWNPKVFLSKGHVKENKLTITKKLLQKVQNSGRSSVRIKVQATDKNGNKGKEQTYWFTWKSPNYHKPDLSYIKAKRKSLKMKRKKRNFGNSVQISTNKKFKNARIKNARTVKKNGKIKYKYIYEIKKLKPKTSYYIRRRYTKSVKTSKGYRKMTGPWSAAIKVRTKK